MYPFKYNTSFSSFYRYKVFYLTVKLLWKYLITLIVDALIYINYWSKFHILDGII